MIDLFRSTNVGFFISVCLVVLVCTIFVVISTYPIKYISLGLLCIMLNGVIFEMIARKRVKKIDQILLDDCDVKNYIAAYEILSQKRTSKAIKIHILLCLAAGHLNSGNSAEVLRVLSTIKAFPKNIQRAVYEFQYHTLYCSYYLQVNDVQAAEQSLAQMEETLQKHKWNKLKQAQCWAIYSEKQCLIRMASGNYEGSEQVFDLAYRRGESTLQKVIAKYILAEIYLHDGKTAEAKEAFTYVAQYGGSTRYQKQAVRQLEHIDDPDYVPPSEESTPAPPEKQLPVQMAITDKINNQRIFGMSIVERKRYNLVIFVLFTALFCIYGGLGVWGHLSMDDISPFPGLAPLPGSILSLLFYGSLGGWGFSSLVGGIWLGCRFVSRKGKGFIVLACVLFLFTVQVFWIVGLVLTLPFAIYNVVLLRRSNVPE